MTTPSIDPNVTIFDLSLDDVPRAKIVIPGFGEFELAESDDYSIPVLKAINRMWDEVSKLSAKETITAKEGDVYEKNINALLKYACPKLSSEVYSHPNFKRTEKSAIVSAFFIENMSREMPMRRRLTAVEAEAAAEISDSLSQDFIDSMAEASAS